MPIEPTRIAALNDAPPGDGDYVLYWMQASQRDRVNHALEYAIQQANDADLPLVVGFGIMDDCPEANERHYRFMIQGLAEVARALAERHIQFCMRHGHPATVAIELGRKAAEVVCDRGYLRHQKAWRRQVAEKLDCRVVQVETDTVVPLHVASDKAEYAARTIRPRIHRHLDDYLQPLARGRVDHSSMAIDMDGMDLTSVDQVMDSLKLDRSVGPVDRYFVGGYEEARKRLDRFLEDLINDYADGRNEPADNIASNLSPYLHFGQISPLEIALAVRSKRATRSENKEAFLEELLVRRQLSQNWCEFTENYDAYEALPEWARRTLATHGDDHRPHLYGREELEAAETHDRYWNAAMLEMKKTGFMHNYMRMYWAKKILEWSPNPKAGFEITLAINNKYFLDGRDPSSYVGVGWTYGLHDRAWTERPVFGKVRYMAASGLERKFDIEAYVEKVNRLQA